MNTFLIGILFFIIFTFGLIGNMLLIFKLMYQKRGWISTMTYVINLAVSDLFFVSTMPLWGYVYLHDFEWIFGDFLCKLCGTIPTFNMFSSCFFLTAIAIDRWLAVVKKNGQILRSPTNVKSACALVWMLSGLIVAHRVPLMKISTNTTATNATKACAFFIDVGENKLFIAGLLEFLYAMLGFFFPVCAMIYCYVRIIFHVKKNSLGTSERSPLSRVVKLGLAIITAFIICWLPGQTLRLYSSLNGWWHFSAFNENLYNNIYPITICLAWLNSIVNPVIYVFTERKVHKNVCELCCFNFNKRNNLTVKRKNSCFTKFSLRSIDNNSEMPTTFTQVYCKSSVTKKKSSKFSCIKNSTKQVWFSI